MQLEDLDDLHANFVEPLMARYAEVSGHRKFLDELLSRIDDVVSMEKRSEPKSVPYKLGFDNTRGGISIVLTFQVGSKPHHEHFCATPRGFYFRRKMMKSVEHVLMAFKKDPYNKDMREIQQQKMGYSAQDAMQSHGQYMQGGQSHGQYVQGMLPPPGGGYMMGHMQPPQYMGGQPQYVAAGMQPQGGYSQQQQYSQGQYNQTQQQYGYSQQQPSSQSQQGYY
eukprot:gene17812-24190_t